MLIAYALKRTDEERKPTPNIELYGELEDLNGTSLVALEKMPIEDTIYNCKVILDGEEYPSILYLWLDRDLEWQGIIVKKDDVNAKEARQYYEYHRRMDNYTQEELAKVCPRSNIAELCDDKSEDNCKECNLWNKVWHS